MTFRVQGNPRALRGKVTVPGDKSIAHRAVLFSAMASGLSEIRGFPRGEDNLSTVSAVRALGCQVEDDGQGALVVHGKGRSALKPPQTSIDCGNSGTTARLLAGLLAGCGIEAEIIGDASLSSRPMERIAIPLRTMGANISTRDGYGTLPMVVRQASLTGVHVDLAVASAQVKSAVLLAALGAEGRTALREPFPSRDHSERMLSEMGVRVDYEPCFAAIDGPVSTLNPISITVPGDPSSAAFFICLAAMVPGSDLQISTMLDNPGRTGFLKVLERMGARFERLNPRIIGGEPVVDLRIVGTSLHGTEITAAEVPSCIDEIPALSVVMSCARGPSRVSGASELRVKEADRISGMMEGLKAMGAEGEEFKDGFALAGASLLSAAEVDGMGDHRLVMALTIAASIATGQSSIHSANDVSISFPGFDKELSSLGVNITRT